MGKQLIAGVAIAGLATVVLLLLTKGAARPPVRDLAGVQESLVQAWNKARSVKASMSMQVDGPAATQQRGTYEMKADGDRRLVRVEMTMMDPRAKGSSAAPRMTSVSDGAYTYVLHEQGGQTSAVRSALDPSMHMDPVQFFAKMEAHGEMELLPDETVDGREVVVIRVTPKGGDLADGYVSYYLAKDCGLITQMVAIESAAGTTTRARLTDVQLDVDIPSDRFVFRTPPGVVVQEAATAP